MPNEFCRIIIGSVDFSIFRYSFIYFSIMEPISMGSDDGVDVDVDDVEWLAHVKHYLSQSPSFIIRHPSKNRNRSDAIEESKISVDKIDIISEKNDDDQNDINHGMKINDPAIIDVIDDEIQMSKYNDNMSNESDGEKSIHSSNGMLNFI